MVESVVNFAQQIMQGQNQPASRQASLESELLTTIMNSGLLDHESHRQTKKYESDSNSQDTDELPEDQQLQRLRKKPEKLRKQLFEILLRKRIFLTDRMEKIEKLLLHYGLITE